MLTLKSPARRGRAGLVFRVSPGWSVCRGDLGDGGAGGCLVDEVLAGPATCCSAQRGRRSCIRYPIAAPVILSSEHVFHDACFQP